jgi:hypothetical protein
VYRGGDLVGARTAVEAPMARSGAFHITKAPGPDQLPKAMARVTSEHWPRRELPSLPRGGPGTGLPSHSEAVSEPSWPILARTRRALMGRVALRSHAGVRARSRSRHAFRFSRMLSTGCCL